MISSLSILSLNSRWMALVARKTWMRGVSAFWTASQARSMSSSRQRARPQMIEPRTLPAMAWTASKSPGEAMGKPASITSTPRSTRAWASSSFSARFMLQPGDCSPSRSVVSKITMRRCDDSLIAMVPWKGEKNDGLAGTYRRTESRPLVGGVSTNQVLVGLMRHFDRQALSPAGMSTMLREATSPRTQEEKTPRPRPTSGFRFSLFSVQSG